MLTAAVVVVPGLILGVGMPYLVYAIFRSDRMAFGAQILTPVAVIVGGLLIIHRRNAWIGFAVVVAILVALSVILWVIIALIWVTHGAPIV